MRASKGLLKALDLDLDLGPRDSPEYIVQYMRIRRRAQTLQRRQPQTWLEALAQELTD